MMKEKRESFFVTFFAYLEGTGLKGGGSEERRRLGGTAFLCLGEKTVAAFFFWEAPAGGERRPLAALDAWKGNTLGFASRRQWAAKEEGVRARWSSSSTVRGSGSTSLSEGGYSPTSLQHLRGGRKKEGTRAAFPRPGC